MKVTTMMNRGKVFKSLRGLVESALDAAEADYKKQEQELVNNHKASLAELEKKHEEEKNRIAADTAKKVLQELFK